MRRGPFLVIEGIDGCGKSTQASRLAAHLQGRGRPCRHLREPGSTPLGEGLRRLLLDRETGEIDPLAEALLFLAARRELLTREVLPAQARGETVICERFHPSTICYQGAGMGVGMDKVEELARLTTPEVQPHLVVLLDLAADRALARFAGTGRDRLEDRGGPYLERVRQGFLELAAREKNMVVVDADRPVAQVGRAVVQEVERVLAGA